MKFGLNNYTVSWFLGFVLLIASAPASAIAQLFDGREEINGITLLRDSVDKSLYYYVPPFPRVATLETGQTAFSFTRFSGGTGSGGATLNVMVEFTLAPDFLKLLEAELNERYNSSRIVGPVTFTDPADDLESGEKTSADFKLVSATLGSPGTHSVTSGSAPIGAGGRAAIAARLNEEEAALMWSAFQTGALTDIAFEVDAAYLAHIEAFNAVVEAEMSTVYEHFSEIDNEQQGIKRDQMRDIADTLIREQVMTVRSTDTGEAFNINSSRSEKILEMIVEKLIDVMFDVESGWSTPVNYENPVEEGQIDGRIEGGTISGSALGVAMFGGDIGYTQHTDYVPDDQYVLRNRSDVRINTFRLDLSRSQVIRVPYRTTGSIGGAYASLGDDPRYFNYIDLDDETRDRSEIKFAIDSSYADAFGSLFDSVVVELQHGQGAEKSGHSLRLNAADIANSRLEFEPITIRRLGSKEPGWNRYRYRVHWNVRGESQSISKGWIEAQDPRPTLRPQLQRTEIKVLFDTEVFSSENMRVAMLEIMASLNGRKQILKTVRSLIGKPQYEIDVVVFHDHDSHLVSRARFITRSKTLKGAPDYVENNLVYVLAPEVRND